MRTRDKRADHIVAKAWIILALTACDLPTSLPVFEPRFVVEGERTSLPISQLLPAGLTPAGTSFTLGLAGAPLTRTLGELCGAPCIAANGRIVPKPPFTVEFTLPATLQSEVRSGVVSGGTINVTLVHGFNFDPIQPGGATRGSITATLLNGTNTIGSATRDGATQSFPANNPVTIAVPITAGSTVASPITLRIGINSPLGAPVQITTSQSFGVTVSAQTLALSAVTVDVANRLVSLQQVTLNFTNIDKTVQDHVTEGALLLELRNDFNLNGTLTMSFGGGLTIADKALTLAPGVTTQRIPFSRGELLQLFARQAPVSISGRVSAPGGVLTLLPTQALAIATKLDLKITTGTNQ